MVLQVAIVHPDLGLGGAELLMINIALALEKSGHEVKIYTPFYDPERAFEETKNLFIEVRGMFFRSIFGRALAFCAIVRMFLCSLYVVLFAGRFDVIMVD